MAGALLTGMMATATGRAETDRATKTESMKTRLLIVVTSHAEKGSTGQPTGFYLSEVSHPWEILTEAGYEIDFVSPKGGKAPVDGFDLDDPVNRKFWEDPVYREKIENTLKPSAINPADYAAVLYAGGHGAMWDFPENKQLAQIASAIYANGGIVGGICHGVAGLMNIENANGDLLIKGKRINGFTDDEEKAIGLENVVPFLLETELVKRGALFEKSGLWQSHVTVDDRIITAQNPASGKSYGEAVLKEIRNLDKAQKPQPSL